MRVLAVETSCDDTGVAILKYKKNSPPELLANLISSQIKIHAPWGGVVPTLAKREHQKNIVPLFKQAISESGLLKIKNLKLKIKNYNLKLKILNFEL